MRSTLSSSSAVTSKLLPLLSIGLVACVGDAPVFESSDFESASDGGQADGSDFAPYEDDPEASDGPLAGLDILPDEPEPPVLEAHSTASRRTPPDIATHPAAHEIRFLFDQEIVSGFPDGFFRPGNAVTRAQFAAMLANAVARGDRPDARPFPDVAASHWAHGAISRVSAAGFMSGYPDGNFRPDQTITRVEVVVALANGLRLSGGTWGAAERRYSDARDVAAWAREAVAHADHAGFFANRALHAGGERLGPGFPASRAHVASYLYHALHAPERPPARDETVLSVVHPGVLAQLEGHLGLGSLFSVHEWGSRRARANNRELADNSPWYLSLARYVEGEVERAQRGERTTLGAAGLDPRRLNTRWLLSGDARFDLIGLVNRVDRMDIDDSSCGELRLLYRLSYRRNDLRPAVASRLPVTLAVVYDVVGAPGPDGYSGCVAAARRFRVDRELRNQSDYVAWLRERFDGTDSARFRFRQVELNAQAIRIPSESAPELGGQAEYLLRVLRPVGRQLEPVRLQNTPDVARLARSAELRERLRRWLTENATAVDRGIANIPEEFLATEVTAFTTHGANRRINHPFSQVFQARDFSGLDLRSLSVSTAEGFLERLDDLTCQGCHMGASVAGFHVLGHDPSGVGHPLNGVRLAHSTHYGYELERRRSYQQALTEGRRPETRRPLSYLSFRSRPAPAGSPCLGNAGCASGLECQVVSRGAVPVNVGTCMRPSSVSVGGDACLTGSLTETVSDPRRVTIGTTRTGCGGYGCIQPVQGTPAGLCIAGCGPGNEARSAHDICAFNGGASFDACAASGNFAACLGESTTRGLRTACDEATPCREDYICQRLVQPSGGGFRSVPPMDRGFCVPTYFLFQMRIDGHPTPR